MPSSSRKAERRYESTSPGKVDRMYESESSQSPGVSPVARRKEASPVTVSRHVEKGTQNIENSEDDDSLGLPEDVAFLEQSEVPKEQVEEATNQIDENSEAKTLEVQPKPVLPFDDESKKKTDSPGEELPDV